MITQDTPSATHQNGTTESERIAERGLEWYESKLKSQLEPSENGRFVAIHAESGDYEVAGNSPDARRALRQRFPTGYIVTRKIGPEPDFALAARLLAGEFPAQGDEMTAGRFRDGLPRIPLEIPTGDGAQEIDFVFDTGFNGDLSLPPDIARRLPNAAQGSRFIRLAGGFQRRCDCYEIAWEDEDGEPRLIEVLVMEGNPLMGTSLLKNHLLSIELIEGGEVLAEPF